MYAYCAEDSRFWVFLTQVAAEARMPREKLDAALAGASAALSSFTATGLVRVNVVSSLMFPTCRDALRAGFC